MKEQNIHSNTDPLSAERAWNTGRFGGNENDQTRTIPEGATVKFSKGSLEAEISFGKKEPKSDEAASGDMVSEGGQDFSGSISFRTEMGH